MLTRGDALIIVIVLACSLALAGMIYAAQYHAGGGQREAVVTLGGAEIARFPLAEDEGESVQPFSFVYNAKEYTGQLLFAGARVRLLRLPEEISPLPIHANMGWISQPRQVIVCLPIELVVRIEEAGDVAASARPVDAVTW